MIPYKNKSYTCFLPVILSLLVLTGCSRKGGCCYDNEELEKTENQSAYSIKIGQTFKIMIEQNASTGSSNCWLNEASAKAIKLNETKYYGHGSKDCMGCGETVVYTFIGIRKGLDSIKMKNCPTGIEQKNCSQFAVDSVGIDNLFVVTVE